MAVVTAEEFLALAEASRLLPEVAIDAMRRRLSACASFQPTYDDVASQWIIEGLLTAWQAERIAEGHGASLLLDKYKLLDQIGHGGMGVVFKAEHLVMGRQVALKMLFKAKLDNPTAVARFHREVRALGKLDHPNIVVAHDAGRFGDVSYLVMEFIEGRDLGALGKQWGRLPLPWACEFIRQAAFGLQHAHDKGMIHRDVKPANLLVTIPEPGARPIVKVLDLGLAKFSLTADEPQRVRSDAAVSGAGGSGGALATSTDFDLADDEPPADLADATADGSDAPSADSAGFSVGGFSVAGLTRDGVSRDGLTQDGHIIGTPDFLAPEQVHGLSPVDGRSDVFSLGCTLFKLLTGELPFGGDTVPEKVTIRGQIDGPPATPLRRVLPTAPPGLEVVLARMLARDSVERYSTPAEAAAALEPFCAPRGGWDRRATADPNSEPSSFALSGAHESTVRSSSTPTPPAVPRPAQPPAALLAPLPWLDPGATQTLDLTPFSSAAPATRPSHVTKPIPVVRPIASATATAPLDSLLDDPLAPAPRGAGSAGIVGATSSPASSGSLPLGSLPPGATASSPLLAAEVRRAALRRRRRMRKLAVIFGAAFAVTLALGLIGHAMRQKPIMPYDPAATAEHEASGERPGEASLIPGGASSASAATSPLKSSPLKTEDKTKTPEPPLVPTPPLANSPNKSKPSDKSKSPDAWKPAWPGDKSAKKIPK